MVAVIYCSMALRVPSILLLRYISRSYSGGVHVWAMYTFLHPDNFLMFASLNSSPLSPLSLLLPLFNFLL